LIQQDLGMKLKSLEFISINLIILLMSSMDSQSSKQLLKQIMSKDLVMNKLLNSLMKINKQSEICQRNKILLRTSLTQLHQAFMDITSLKKD